MERLTYEQFRSGLTFRQAYEMIWDRKYKRRHGVLGFMRQHKQQMYQEYLRRMDEIEAAEPPAAAAAPVPEVRARPAAVRAPAAPISIEAWRAARVKRRLTPAARAA